ncbi:hypothetical protein, partial [Flagellimonas marinaquae]
MEGNYGNSQFGSIDANSPPVQSPLSTAINQSAPTSPSATTAKPQPPRTQDFLGKLENPSPALTNHVHSTFDLFAQKDPNWFLS